MLHNGSTTVVQIRQSESIEQLMNRILDKRGLCYKSFDIFTDKHAKVSKVVTFFDMMIFLIN